MIIFLIGMSRAGKTETGRVLAKRLGCSFIDTDSYMEKKYGLAIRNLYQKYGEINFRIKECEAFKEIIKSLFPFSVSDKYISGCQNSNKNAVISTGGGFADNIAIIEILKNYSNIVLIDTEPSLIFERIQNTAIKNGFYPAFFGKNIKDKKDAEKCFFSIYKRRMKVYRSIASVCIKSVGKSSEKIAGEIIRFFYMDKS